MSSEQSRRAFLKRAAAVSMVGAASPFVMNLAAIGEAAAATASDYKALVCIFLFGGNDYANTIVPTTSRATISTTVCGERSRSPATASPRPFSIPPPRCPAAANMRSPRIWRR